MKLTHKNLSGTRICSRTAATIRRLLFIWWNIVTAKQLIDGGFKHFCDFLVGDCFCFLLTLFIEAKVVWKYSKLVSQLRLGYILRFPQFRYPFTNRHKITINSH